MLDWAVRYAPPHVASLAKAKLKPRKPTERQKAAKAVKAGKRLTKRESNARVYAAVRERDAGCCTASRVAAGPCGGSLEIDHQWGRGKEPTRVENCRLLCRDHHRRKTDSEPDRIVWLMDFQAHALRHQYWAEAAKARAMEALERAQHPARAAQKGMP